MWDGEGPGRGRRVPGRPRRGGAGRGGRGLLPLMDGLAYDAEENEDGQDADPIEHGDVDEMFDGNDLEDALLEVLEDAYGPALFFAKEESARACGVCRASA